ncbi:MAG: hypothetical protein H6662_02860 [Ardenticatenaceae bacterium]|nr:hypothetical protein [Ardenticatenaceae bacterium]
MSAHKVASAGTSQFAVAHLHGTQTGKPISSPHWYEQFGEEVDLAMETLRAH